MAAEQDDGETYVFGGNSPLTPTGLARWMERYRQRTGAVGVVHGFRSSFRDWAGNETQFPREVCEEALGHAVGDAVERSYRRGDALAKRRALMGEWATFCDAPATDGKVISMHRKA
jgi:integrase